MLRAFLRAGAALGAVAGQMKLARKGARCGDVLLHSLEPPVGKRGVVCVEATGDVHLSWTGHAVAAACARNLVAFGDGRFRRIDGAAFGFGKAARACVAGGCDVFLQLIERVHAGKHHGHLGLIPKPAKGEAHGVGGSAFFR